MIHPTDRRWPAAGGAYLAVYGLTCLAVEASTGFHVDLNDFWGNVALAELAESHPASLYSPFFPFGYTLLLRLLPGDTVVAAHLLNLVCGLTLVWSTWRCGAAVAGEPWGIAAMVLVSVDPQVFRYITTPGPDVPAAALCALGLSRLLAMSGSTPPQPFGSGAVLGLAALFRYHAMVFAGAAIVATAMARQQWRRHIVLAGAGFAAVYVAQMLVAVAAGQSPMHTGQAFIFHKLMYGVNWFQVTGVTVADSPLAVVREAPGTFAAAYGRMLLRLWTLPLAAALLAIVARDTPRRRFGQIALVVMVPYLAVVASGGSSRGSLPVHFLAAISVAALFSEVAVLAARRAPAFRGALLTMLGGVALLDARADHGIVKRRLRTEASYREVEAMMKADGAQSAKDVFASDFALYFVSLPLSTPRTNGSWLRVDGTRYSAKYPELCVMSTECLRADARRLGVTHVVLTADAVNLSAALGQVYDGAYDAAFEPIGIVEPFKVFRVR